MHITLIIFQILFESILVTPTINCSSAESDAFGSSFSDSEDEPEDEDAEDAEADERLFLPTDDFLDLLAFDSLSWRK